MKTKQNKTEWRRQFIDCTPTLWVLNLERSVNYYHETLHFYAVRCEGGYDVARGSMSFFLVEAPREYFAMKEKYLAYKDGEYDDLTFNIADLDEYLLEINQTYIDYDVFPHKDPENGNYTMTIRDPDGNLLRFVEDQYRTDDVPSNILKAKS